MKSFSEFNFSPPIAKAIAELGFKVPTPIQAQTIPLLRAGRTDLLGMAATGTGKTAAYGLPLLESIVVDQKNTQAVILCPTRELAVQVTEQINCMGKYKKVSALAIYGGAGYVEQMHALKKGVQIVVATPGRLIDFIKRELLKLDGVSTLVLDEADEMISMGFQEPLEFILQQVCAEKSQRWLFSATMNGELRKVADTYLRNPKLVHVNQKEMLSGTVRQIYYSVLEPHKPMGICRIIDMAEDFYGLIFCQTKALVTDLTNYMKQRGYQVDCLHGDKTQRERLHTLNLFKSKAVNILVCSDVAARGLDVKDITHVINYSLPFEFDYYVHRIGRTGRSGKPGLALSLVTPNQRHLIRRIEARTKTNMEVGTFPSQAQINAKKITALLSKFGEVTLPPQMSISLGEAWINLVKGMSPEEIAGRFITLFRPELFADSEKVDINSIPDSEPNRPKKSHRGKRFIPGRGHGAKVGGWHGKPKTFSPAAGKRHSPGPR